MVFFVYLIIASAAFRFFIPNWYEKDLPQVSGQAIDLFSFHRSPTSSICRLKSDPPF
jgi:hypothetical protein